MAIGHRSIGCFYSLTSRYACILCDHSALLQTGTGKTHTMEGALAEEDTARPEAGIIPRACNTIFDRLDAV
jgi:hypothetical protein